MGIGTCDSLCRRTVIQGHIIASLAIFEFWRNDESVEFGARPMRVRYFEFWRDVESVLFVFLAPSQGGTLSQYFSYFCSQTSTGVDDGCGTGVTGRGRGAWDV